MAKILVVDDDTTFCIMLKNWLGKRKFEVENAFTCKEAVKNWREPLLMWFSRICAAG